MFPILIPTKFSPSAKLTLKAYMQYVTKVRSYVKDMAIEEAVAKAIEESICQDILREFLLQNKAEVKKMSIYEYDDEAVKQALKEDAYEEGKTDGKIEGKIESVLLLLESSASPVPFPKELRKRIMEETDANVLEQWLRFAAEARSLMEFIDKAMLSKS